MQNEDKKELLEKYVPVSNFPLINPPKMSPEVKLFVPESAIKRDARLSNIQVQVGACMAAVGHALTILPDEKGAISNLKIIELLGDSSRLLADLHYTDS